MAQFVDPAEIAKTYREQHPEVDALDEESVEYYTKLAQPTLADRASDAAQGDVFSRAAKNFKDEVAANNVTNIHGTRDVKLDTEAAKKQVAAAPTDFDSTALETDVGLTPGAIDKLGITDHATAVEAIRGIAHATAQSVSDETVDQLIDSWAGEPALEALSQRIRATIDNFQSPKYGNSADLNSVAAVERAKLVHHALKQNIGLARNNLKGAPIETLLKRARFALDPDHQPYRSKPSESQSPQKRRMKAFVQIITPSNKTEANTIDLLT
jgi:hypothetical protein